MVDRDEKGRRDPATSQCRAIHLRSNQLTPAFSTVRFTFIAWTTSHTHKVRLVPPPALQMLILLFYIIYHILHILQRISGTLCRTFSTALPPLKFSPTQQLPVKFRTLNVHLLGLSTTQLLPISVEVNRYEVVRSPPTLHYLPNYSGEFRYDLASARIPLACHAVRLPTFQNIPAFGLPVFIKLLLL